MVIKYLKPFYSQWHSLNARYLLIHVGLWMVFGSTSLQCYSLQVAVKVKCIPTLAFLKRNFAFQPRVSFSLTQCQVREPPSFDPCAGFLLTVPSYFRHDSVEKAQGHNLALEERCWKVEHCQWSSVNRYWKSLCKVKRRWWLLQMSNSWINSFVPNCVFGFSHSARPRGLGFKSLHPIPALWCLMKKVTWSKARWFFQTVGSFFIPMKTEFTEC